LNPALFKNPKNKMPKNREDQNLLIIQPSQWINVGWFILPIIAAALYTPLAIVLSIVSVYKYIEVDTWSYIFRIRGLEERKGVFSIIQEEVQYFRIKSIMIEEPFLMRIVGLSIVHIISSERYKPNLKLYGIKNGNKLKNKINSAVYEWRDKLGVRDYDITGV